MPQTRLIANGALAPRDTSQTVVSRGASLEAQASRDGSEDRGSCLECEGITGVEVGSVISVTYGVRNSSAFLNNSVRCCANMLLISFASNSIGKDGCFNTSESKDGNEQSITRPRCALYRSLKLIRRIRCHGRISRLAASKLTIARAYGMRQI